ncbi:MAG: hypothetical protein WD607_05455 [Candidatus Paceibacterota bacterium]
MEDSPPFPISVSKRYLVIDDQTRRPFPGTTDELLSVNSVTEIDYNYSFRNDLAMAGSAGFKLFRLNDDHPVGTDVFVNERFVFPAPDHSSQIMTTPTPVGRVLDDQGNDLTDTVSKIDQNYIKPFEKTAYQGLVKDHSIIIELEDKEGKMVTGKMSTGI